MKITEKMLLDGYDGITKGGDLISKVNNIEIFWAYRTGRDNEGYNCVCDRDSAGEITLEYDRVGRIELSADCDNHPSLKRISSDENKLWGDEV